MIWAEQQAIQAELQTGEIQNELQIDSAGITGSLRLKHVRAEPQINSQWITS